MLKAWQLACLLVVLFAIAAGLGGIVAYRGFGGNGANSVETLPDLGQVPGFSLIDTDGQTFGSSDLSGKVYVVDFIFTRCALACPIMTLHMQEVSKALKSEGVLGEAILVSVTVDPAYDTPRVLKEFAERYEVDANTWKFLTTDQERQKIWQLVEKGFMLPLDDTPENKLMPIQHSTRFVLVDQQGRIRGYYHSEEPEDRAQLVKDVVRLVQQ